MIQMALFTLMCAAIIAFADPVSKRFAKFWSNYPLVRLFPQREFVLRPFVLRIGVVVVLAGVWCGWWLGNRA
jgi:hypothetical protein